MIITFASGQFGNQLFQYLFCKKIQTERGKNERIYLIGYHNLLTFFERKCFQNVKFIKRENKLHRIFLNRILRNFILKIFAQFKLISTCSIKKETVLDRYERETTNYEFKTGLFKNILFFPTFYAQSEIFFNKVDVNQLNPKQEVIEKAIRIIRNDQEKIKIFVHLRLGDYQNFTIYGNSAILPISYFETCCNFLLEKYKDNILFYIISNEKNLEQYSFIKNLKNYKIIQNDFEVDFAIMTLCNGAIISASSFSWWGSYFMKNKIEIFAPKHWLGFSSEIDFQSQPTRDEMLLIDIKA